jgi:co-chaperonin GroES (HSP10)
MDLKIIGEKVIAEQYTEKVIGGIIVPDTAKNTMNRGKVVGSGVAGIEVGQDVVWVPGWGTYFEYEGKPYVFLKPDDILGVK